MINMSSVELEADREYPWIFHSPGLEPWICGLLKKKDPASLLDIGCGFGFWGFIARTYIDFKGKMVGLDLSKKRINFLKTLNIYDRLLNCDIRSSPIMKRKFDCALAIEVLHGFEQLQDTLRNIENSLRKNGMVIIASPSERGLLDALRKRNYKIYSCHFRGLILVEMEKKKTFTMYNSKKNKIMSSIWLFLHKLFGKERLVNYIIAFKTVNK